MRCRRPKNRLSQNPRPSSRRPCPADAVGVADEDGVQGVQRVHRVQLTNPQLTYSKLAYPKLANPLNLLNLLNLLNPLNRLTLRRSSRVAAALAIVVLLVWAGRRYAPSIVPIIAAVHDLGPLGPLFFIAIYFVAVVALVPASWMTVAGGAVFGIVPGALYALIGATIGSTAAFLIGRYVARRAVARHLDAMPRFGAIDRAVSADARRIITLLRLSPVTPFNFLNYALGLTTVSVWDFVIGGFGMIPGAFVYAYAGDVAGQALVVAGQAAVPRNASYYAMLAAGLVATFAAVLLVARAAQRALRDV